MREIAEKSVRAGRQFASIIIIVALAACGGGGSSSGGSAGDGNLVIRLTDNHTNAVSEVNVRIVGLMVKPSNGPAQRLRCCNITVDLLELQNSSMLLAAADVDPGRYDFVQVELDQDRSNVVVAGQVRQLKIPSEKIKVVGGFKVAPNGTTNVLLDFDAHQSLISQGNGQWLMKPVILLANVSMSRTRIAGNLD